MLSDDQLQTVYSWVDVIPLSRPKRNIGRDFSDGVLMAEVINHYHPNLVDLHNYSSANGVTQKTYNWKTLNGKVFSKLGYKISQSEINDIVVCKPEAIERALFNMKSCLSRYSARLLNSSGGGEIPSSLKQQPQRMNEGLSSSSPAPSRLYNNSGSMHQEPAEAKVKSPQQTRQNRSTNRQEVTKSQPRRQRPQQQQQRENKANVDDLLAEKEETIAELTETVDILELKIKKLEQLVRLKDNKIATLMSHPGN